MTGDYHFYGAPISYFSGKLRFYLQLKRIPYIDHCADMDVFEKIIMPRVGLPFIPVLITPGDETLQDTTDIIDYLEEHHPDRELMPADPQIALLMRLMELWVDEFLINPGLTMRWSMDENLEWVYEEFGRVAFHHKRGIQVRAFGEKQAQRIMRYMPKLGFDDPALVKACRYVFDGLLSRFETLLKQRDFLLGNTPCLGDVYLMGPIYAHWMQDPATAALVRQNYHYVAMWADRMLTANAQAHSQDWTVDELALDLLAEAGRGFGKMMLQGAQALDGMLSQLSSGDELPRGGPSIDSMILNAPVTRKANPYWFYKYQRVWEAWQKVQDPESCKPMLNAMGVYELVTYQTERRVAKDEKGKLVVG